MSTQRSLLLSLLVLATCVADLTGQTAVLRGQVVDATSRAPLDGAEVLVLERGRQAITDAAGRFVVERLDPGVVQVEVRFLGYRSVVLPDVVLQPSRSTFVEAALERQAIELEGIVVGAGAFRVPEAAATSVQVLAAEEIRRTPGGLLDVSRTLLSLPGVLGGVDNRNDLLVRGGGPGENAYFLDGIRIPQINHFATQGATGGALGLVNVDFIRETEFYTGAFPVRYGDALSSVLLIENRPGSPEGVRGDATLGATEAALTLDGPLGEDATWLLSVRRSYLQFLFAALGLPIRPDYWDAQTRVEWNPTERDRVVAVGLGALDDFDIVPPEADDEFENREIFQRVIDNDQKSGTVGASWRRLLGDGYVTTSLSHSASDFRFSDPDRDGEPLLRNRSLERTTRLAVDGEGAFGRRWTLAAGVGAVRSSIESDVFQRATPGSAFEEDLSFDDSLGLWRSFGYAQATRSGILGRVDLTAGLRADRVSVLDEPWGVSPRGSVEVALSSALAVQLAAGVFHQRPPLVSLVVRDGTGERANLGLPQLRNRQVVAGLAWEPGEGSRVTLEGFWKRYDDVPVLEGDRRIALPNLGGDYGFVGAEPLVATGWGRAHGLELFARQRMGRAWLLGAYTWSRSEFAGEDGRLRPSAWDRRHALDLTAGYRLGRAWELGAKLRVLSGLATTPFDLEASAEEYARSGRGVRDWDRVGALRTPAYARLDLRAERVLSFDGWNAVVFLDVQNVLGRDNVVGYRYTEDPAYADRIRPVDGSTVLPTFGFSVEF